MTEPDWVPLGDSGIQVIADRLTDPRNCEMFARLLDYQAQCKQDGVLMHPGRVTEIINAKETS
jgi:hypothetical protein